MYAISQNIAASLQIEWPEYGAFKIKPFTTGNRVFEKKKIFHAIKYEWLKSL